MSEHYQTLLHTWLHHYAVQIKTTQAERKTRMNAVNPRYVLINYLVQQAIDAAERDDFEEIHRLLDVLRKPYNEQPQHLDYAKNVLNG